MLVIRRPLHHLYRARDHPQIRARDLAQPHPRDYPPDHHSPNDSPAHPIQRPHHLLPFWPRCHIYDDNLTC